MKTVIVLMDVVSVYQRPRRLAPREKMAMDQQIQEWLAEDIIRPSCSEYASPVLLVKKKDETLRLCIDYRELNKKIVRDRYPLPLIDDQIDRLRGAVIFSTLDLRNGFFHVSVDEPSVKYTSFVVPSSQYEFLRTPFGLCISPPVFQRYVNFIFRDLIRLGYFIFSINSQNTSGTSSGEMKDKPKKYLIHFPISVLALYLFLR
ncbi:Transposon Ty3-G Gag-Pol polyprotein [Aphis craccivora]|uniref:Transposon Ty3-G Gag-Pol polyprotein n=1 Tax=Aphis craccivora TaxID=307492 RepID=A0A6G0X7W1_APHCR|nr:Transposon Ty3-G Gag-Pol polyprotein [Aphis craccivora]